MAKDVDYNSLKEKLYSKKESIKESGIEKEPSQYKIIKERLKGSEGHSSDIKVDSIVYVLGNPKNFNNLSIPIRKIYPDKESFTHFDYINRNTKKGVKKIVESYTKKDIEEAIINELHNLNYGLGIKAIHRTSGGRIYWGPEKKITKVSGGYRESLDNIKKLETILSNKRFLRKKGITNEEIKKYQGTFKKRVMRILNAGVEKAEDRDDVGSMERILDYAKKEGLINYKRNGLEKSLAVLSIGSILAGIFFLSPNLTGNVIGNIAKSSGNILGGILFILGIIGAFFTLRK